MESPRGSFGGLRPFVANPFLANVCICAGVIYLGQVPLRPIFFSIYAQTYPGQSNAGQALCCGVLLVVCVCGVCGVCVLCVCCVCAVCVFGVCGLCVLCVCVFGVCGLCASKHLNPEHLNTP